MLALGPGDLLDHDAAGWAVDTTHAVEEKHQEAPNRDELKRTLGQLHQGFRPIADRSQVPVAA